MLAIVVGVVLGRSGRDEAIAPNTTQQEAETRTTAAASGLPETSDYHSLLVSPTDTKQVLLGTHGGLYESVDGGRNWEFAELEDQDAMNLARADGNVVWAAGHDVLARSSDGGRTWEDVRPDGLPGLDVHGFAIDPQDPDRLYAAIAGVGLFRSADGGSTFEAVPTEVGGAVMALAVTRDGRILAGDMQRGLVLSENGGKTWRVALRVGVMGLAVNPEDGKRVLMAGTEGVSLSENGGRTWRPTLSLSPGAGPVAWAPSDPDLAYVVGFDQTLYTTTDGGFTWQPVV